VSFIVVAGLLIYHFKIIFRGLTTYQEIKKHYERDLEYYFSREKTKWENCVSKICSPVPKAFFEPSGYSQFNNIQEEGYNKELHFKEELIELNDKEQVVIERFDYLKRFNSGVKSLNNSKIVQNRYVNSTIQKTFYSRSKNISIENKLPPGEIHISDNEVEKDLENPKKREESFDLDKDSLNRRIISIINSSGTINEFDSEGKTKKTNY
jgi:hypothetical protein